MLTKLLNKNYTEELNSSNTFVLFSYKQSRIIYTFVQMFNSVVLQIFLYIASFAAIWISSGIIVKSIVKLASYFHIPRFTFSFFFLGILTSLPEMSIAFVSAAEKEPEIFVGNLIGGVLIIFMVIVPLLAIASKDLKIPSSFSTSHMLFTLLTCFAPSLFTALRIVTPVHGIILMCCYFFMFLFFSNKQTLFEKVSETLSKKEKLSLVDFLKVIAGVATLFLASQQIVHTTDYFAGVLGFSTFFVSMIIVAVGTNIPEISIAFRSLFEKKSDVALADFFGSAAANTLVFGMTSFFYGSTIQLPNHVIQRFVFLLVSLIIFFLFAQSKKSISRIEGFILLSMYIFFFFIELYVRI